MWSKVTLFFIIHRTPFLALDASVIQVEIKSYSHLQLGEITVSLKESRFQKTLHLDQNNKMQFNGNKCQVPQLSKKKNHLQKYRMRGTWLGHNCYGKKKVRFQMILHQTVPQPNVKKSPTPPKTTEIILAPIIEMQYGVQISGAHHIIHSISIENISRYFISEKYE